MFAFFLLLLCAINKCTCAVYHVAVCGVDLTLGLFQARPYCDVYSACRGDLHNKMYMSVCH